MPDSIDAKRAVEMCSHGNFPSRCDDCGIDIRKETVKLTGRHRFSKELFDLRDVNGNENQEALYVLGELEDIFSPYKWFKGLALMGSSIRGCSTESSDIDLKVFFDSSEMSTKNLRQVVKSAVDKLNGEEKTHKKVSIPYWVDVNIEKIKQGLQNMESHEGFNTSVTVKDLSGFTGGEKVEEVRIKIRQLISKLTPEQQEALFEKVLGYAMREEEVGESKLFYRFNIQNHQKEEFRNNRRVLWEQRIRDLWVSNQTEPS